MRGSKITHRQDHTIDLKKIIVFISIAYGYSWVVWGRQALNHNYELGWEISQWNHLLAGWGPLIGAIFTTLLFEKRGGLKRFFKEKFFTPPPAQSILIGIGMPVAFFAVAYLALGLLQDTWTPLEDIGPNNKVPFTHTFSIWLMWCVFYGLGEEGGWRGFLFPEFCKSFTARTATLYTAILWALWHLPVFFFDPNFQSMGVLAIMGWASGLVFGSLLLGWLVKQSGWSLWPVILWHGTFNLFTAGDRLSPLYPGIMSGLVIVSVLWIARRYGEELSRQR